MASGNFGVTTNNQYIVGNLAWSSSINVEGNYSDINASLRVWRTNTGYTTTGTGTWYLNVDGQVQSETISVSISYNSNTLVIAKAFRVYHNADGSKAINISCSGGISGTSYTATYGGGTAYLDTIPRASQPTLSDGDIDLGTSTTVYMNRASSGFTHTVRYSYGNSTGTIATGVTNSCTWTPPISLSSETPSLDYGTAGIFVDTYNGSTFIGTKMVYITLRVPASVVPTVNSLTLAELNTAVTNVVGSGRLVNNLSNVKITATASGVYGSTIQTYIITWDGIDHDMGTTNVYNDGTLDTEHAGTTIGYSVRVKDSRGRFSAVYESSGIYVLPYNPPNISTFTAQRCLSDGTVDQLGTYLRIVRTATASSLINSTQRNTISATVQYKLRSATEWTTCTSGTNPPSNPTGINVSASSAVASAVGSTVYVYGNSTPIFALTSTYDVRVLVTDKFNTTISQLVIPTGATVMSWSNTGVGIGKVISDNSTHSLELGGSMLLKAGTGIYSAYNNAHILNDHNNGSVTVSATGGALYLGYQNTTYLYQIQSMKAFYDQATKAQLVGDYAERTTNNKMIWTIGSAHNTWATQWGLSYQYGDVGGFTGQHCLTLRAGGVTKAWLGMNNGTAYFLSEIRSDGWLKSGRESTSALFGGDDRAGLKCSVVYNNGYYFEVRSDGTLNISNDGSFREFVTTSPDVKRFAHGGTYLEYRTSAGLAYGCTNFQSDERLKNNVQSTTVTNALSTIMAIDHKSFEWKDGRTTPVELGYSAQDFKAINPALVLDIPQPEGAEYDSLLQIYEPALLPVITKSIQEMKEIIDSQSKRIAYLENIIG